MINKIRSKSSARVYNKSTIKIYQDHSPTYQYRNSSINRAYGVNVRNRIKSSKDVKLAERPADISCSPNNEKNLKLQSKTIPENKIRYSKPTGKNQIIQQEILKSQSDRLELKRDLATYENNFIKNSNVENSLKTLQEIIGKINELCLNTGSLNENNERITKCIKDSVKGGFTEETRGFTVFKESFGVAKRKNLGDQKEFKGVYMISANRCMVSVKSSYLFAHLISCIMPDGKELTVSIEKDISTYPNKLCPDYKKALNDLIFPCVYVNSANGEVSLRYDKALGKNCQSFYLKLMGIKENITVFVTDKEESLLFDIKNTQFSLLVEKLDMGVRDLSQGSINSLKIEIQKNLFIYKNSLVWGKHPFLIRESSSKLLKPVFLRQTFDQDIINAFSVKFSYKGKIFKIEGIEEKKKKHLYVSNSKMEADILEDSYDFSLISGLQSFDFYNCSETIKSSLEWRIVLDRIFK